LRIPLNELAAEGRRRQSSKRREILPSSFTVLLSPRQLPERAYSRQFIERAFATGDPAVAELRTGIKG
jgi:hypothetical protein